MRITVTYPLFQELSEIFSVSNQQFNEEQKFQEICEILLLEGDIPESKIEKKAHQILDNPALFPSFFD